MKWNGSVVVLNGGHFGPKLGEGLGTTFVVVFERLPSPINPRAAKTQAMPLGRLFGMCPIP